MIEWQWLMPGVFMGLGVGWLIGLWLGITEGYTLCRINEHRQQCEVEKGIVYYRLDLEEQEDWKWVSCEGLRHHGEYPGDR